MEETQETTYQPQDTPPILGFYDNYLWRFAEATVLAGEHNQNLKAL